MSEKATRDQSKNLKDLQKLWGPITQDHYQKTSLALWKQI